MNDPLLGVTVRDPISGFEGVVCGVFHYRGYSRVNVRAKALDDGKPKEYIFDVEELQIMREQVAAGQPAAEA